jgi:hypothetical protein
MSPDVSSTFRVHFHWKNGGAEFIEEPSDNSHRIFFVLSRNFFHASRGRRRRHLPKLFGRILTGFGK